MAASSSRYAEQQPDAAGAAAAASSSSGHVEGTSTSSSQPSSSGGTSRPHGKKQQRKGGNSRAASGASSSSSTGSSRHGSSSRHRMTERELKELTRRDSMRVEQVAMFNRFASMAASMSGRSGGTGGSGGRAGRGGRKGQLADLIQLDERVPKFHEEFSKAGRWPPQVDVDWAYEQLWEGYELARALPTHILGLLDAQHVTPQLLLPRLGTLDKERVDWLATAPFGNVKFPDPDTYRGYGGGWQSFVNAPSRTEVLAPGTTHVAIGFVDLGALQLLPSCCLLLPTWLKQQLTLLMTQLQAAAVASTAATPGSTGSLSPLQWVGYEMSAYCVAKALVVLQLVEHGAAVDEVLQVWYSSAWTSDTLAGFRRAVTELLTTAAAISKQQSGQHSSLHRSASALTAPDVLVLLRHWQVKHVPLAAARKGWQGSLDHSFAWLGNFTRKEDRLALCELLLTGQLRALGAADVGSVFGERAFDECFLQCLPFETLVKAWRAHPCADIVTVGVDLLRQRTQLLVAMLKAGVLTAEVRLGVVRLGATDIISAIKSLRIYTVSWSDVPDYMSPAEFHQVARAISAPSDTVHFMHSMNWPKTVKGAFHLDITLSMTEQGLRKAIPDLKSSGELAIGRMYKLLGLEGLLQCPPVDNPRNVVDLGLFFVHHQAWVEAFFAPALSGMCTPQRQVQVVEPPIYSIFSRTNSTFHITFSYDEQIKFSAVPYI